LIRVFQELIFIL